MERKEHDPKQNAAGAARATKLISQVWFAFVLHK